MIRKLPSFIFAIVTLSLQVIFIIILLIVSKFGSMIDGLVMALWTWPLFFMGILALVLGLRSLIKDKDNKKKAIATVIMGGTAIILFIIYAFSLGFFIGTGHLLSYYLINGF